MNVSAIIIKKLKNDLVMTFNYKMSDCNGRGECLKQCFCECYDEVSESYLPVCICGHRDHPKLIGGSTEYDVYCKPDCPKKCTLVKCHNFDMCGEKCPQWLLDCDRGMCKNCAVMIGKIKFLNEKDDCPICFINKDMIEISCGKHKVCLDCWKQWSETGNKIPLTCPLCRESIWK
jgi:hypothetical protein